MKGKNKGKSVKEKELARLIVASKDFSNKYSEIKGYFEKIEKYLGEFKTKEFGENLIPVSVFKNKRLGSLEIVVKYLIEENNLSVDRIAKLLNRSYTTIWNSYHKSRKKYPRRFVSKKGFLVDASIFSDRKVSPLHCIVSFLKDSKNMRFKEVATTLDRDIRNVSYTYHKYKKNE